MNDTGKFKQPMIHLTKSRWLSNNIPTLKQLKLRARRCHGTNSSKRLAMNYGDF